MLVEYHSYNLATHTLFLYFRELSHVHCQFYCKGKCLEHTIKLSQSLFVHSALNYLLQKGLKHLKVA